MNENISDKVFTEVNCITNSNNKFSLDSVGNLFVNSITFNISNNLILIIFTKLVQFILIQVILILAPTIVLESREIPYYLSPKCILKLKKYFH